MLTLQNVNVFYGAIHALKGIVFTVYKRGRGESDCPSSHRDRDDISVSVRGVYAMNRENSDFGKEVGQKTCAAISSRGLR